MEKIKTSWFPTLLGLILLLYPVTIKVSAGGGIFVHPLEFVMAFLWILVAVLIVKNSSIRAFFYRDPILKVYLGLMLTLALSSFYGISVSGVFDLNEFLRVLKYTTYFAIYPLTYLVVRTVGWAYVSKIVKWIIYLSIIPSLYSLSRIAFLANAQSERWIYDINSRSVGFFGQYIGSEGISQTASAAHGVFGLYIAIVILAIATLLVYGSKIARWKLIGVSLINLTALIFTFARMAWLSILIGVNVIFYKRFGFKNWLVFVAVTIILIGSIFMAFKGSEFVNKFSETVNIVQGGISLDASAAGRVVGFEQALKLMTQPQFYFLGVGYSQLNLLSLSGGYLRIIHSLFLDLWVRGGALALALLVLLWIMIGRIIWDGLRLIKEGEQIQLPVLALAFFVPFLLDNLISGQDLFSDAVMVYWWFILGGVAGLIGLEKKGRLA